MAKQTIVIIYYRRDEKDGISPPDLTKICSPAEHIVKARGKRTQYTSLSLDLASVEEFRTTDYRLEMDKTREEGHTVVEHVPLIDELQRIAKSEDKASRIQAIQAIRYARKRKEGLVSWKFDISRVKRKNVFRWAQGKVQVYFVRI